MPAWTIRPASPDDGARAEAFLRTIPEFEGTIEAGVERALWDWLFRRRGGDDPVAPTLWNVLFADDPAGRSVAHYGLAELLYRIDGQPVRGGMVCKLAIDAAYRHEPVFMSLTVQLLRGYAAHGLQFAQALANRGGLLAFHLAFGFTEIGDVPIFAKPFRFRRIAGELLPHWASVAATPVLRLAEAGYRALLRIRLGASRAARGPVRVERVTRLDPSALTPDPSTFLAGRFRYFADRSVEALQWRFFDSPARDYRFYTIRRDGVFLGYFVLRPMTMRGFRTLAIVDLCFDFRRRDVVRAVFREIDRVALECDVDLCAMLVGSAEVEALLRRALYRRSPEHFTFVVHEPKKTGLGVARSAMQDWYVTWFDHDFV
jgi:hypothetical protein